LQEVEENSHAIAEMSPTLNDREYWILFLTLIVGKEFDQTTLRQVVSDLNLDQTHYPKPRSG